MASAITELCTTSATRFCVNPDYNGINSGEDSVLTRRPHRPVPAVSGTATRQRSFVFDSYLDSAIGPIVCPYVTTVPAGIFAVPAPDDRIAAVKLRITVSILQSESARSYEVTNRVHLGWRLG